MSAYIIVHVSPKNPEKLQQYIGQVGPMVKKVGAEVMVQAKVSEVLNGDHTGKMTAVIRFPDMAAIKGWWSSDEYQAIVPLRNEGADMTIIALED